MKALRDIELSKVSLNALVEKQAEKSLIVPVW